MCRTILPLLMPLALACAGCGLTAANSGLTTGSLPPPAKAGHVEAAPLQPVAATEPAAAPAAVALTQSRSASLPPARTASWPAATRPLPDGLKPGYTLQTLRIPVASDGSAKAAEQAALVKAAEFTRAMGGTHFIVVAGNAEETAGLWSQGADFVLHFRVLAPDEGDALPSGAASADEILTFMAKGGGKG